MNESLQNSYDIRFYSRIYNTVLEKLLPLKKNTCDDRLIYKYFLDHVLWMQANGGKQLLTFFVQR